MTLYVIIVSIEFSPLSTLEISFYIFYDVLIKNDRIAVIWEIKKMEIERMFNDNMALRNIYDADPLRHNDDEYRHQIIILV